MGDIIYLHKFMQQDDSSEFIKGIMMEVDDQVKNKHGENVKHSEVFRRNSKSIMHILTSMVTSRLMASMFMKIIPLL